jgi:hypothetical protein
VVAIWTPDSVLSLVPEEEAREALYEDKLVNVVRGVAAPPFPFDRINGFALNDWDGAANHSGWTRLVRTVEDQLVRNGRASPGSILSKLSTL